MSPRPYDRTLRKAAAEEARRRIVEAAAALHATHGGVGTSHAMIARRAGVSIPTVYKYFPTRDHLIPACTGLVASRAPLSLGPGLFEAHRRLEDRVRALARGLFRIHEYFAPWMRWSAGDAAAIPALRDFLEKGRTFRMDLVRRALTPPGRRAPEKSRVALAHVLLDFPAWKVLTESGSTSDQAADLAADAVLRLIPSNPH